MANLKGVQSDRSKYEFISDEYWKYADKDNVQLLNSNGKLHFERISKNYTFSKTTTNTTDTTATTATNNTNNLNVVVIGKTGEGKSATANTILGTKSFIESITSISVTKYSSMQSTQLDNGRTITVLDTPGLFDTHLNNDAILQEIATVMMFFSEGIHAFIIVQDTSTPRFTKQERDTIKLIGDLFGKGVDSYQMLVLTKAESCLDNECLNDYMRRNSEYGDKGLITFLAKLDGRVVAVNNGTTVPAEKKRNQKVIIDMVDEVFMTNSSVYTNTNFARAAEARRALQNKSREKGWSPELMEFIEHILNEESSILDQHNTDEVQLIGFMEAKLAAMKIDYEAETDMAMRNQKYKQYKKLLKFSKDSKQAVDIANEQIQIFGGFRAFLKKCSDRFLDTVLGVA